ncbi:MAG: CinA family protein [Chloroflexota bacterium]
MTEPLEVQLGPLLRELGVTICTAESCTGGLIASRITDVSGSSAYMLGGVVSYSNEAKASILSVRQGSLMAYGAVSEPVASEMALGAKALFKADYAISVTGIAGPGGGTQDKPVGLTFIGLATPDEVIVQKHIWESDRIGNKAHSAEAALQLLFNTVTASAG